MRLTGSESNAGVWGRENFYKNFPSPKKNKSDNRVLERPDEWYEYHTQEEATHLQYPAAAYIYRDTSCCTIVIVITIYYHNNKEYMA